MMAQKFVEENERSKRDYLIYLEQAKGKDTQTVDKAAAAIRAFEESTKFKSFKQFDIEQAIAFKSHLRQMVNARTRKPLSLANIDGTTVAVKDFFIWLSDQPGYKRAIKRTDADYFNLKDKERRVAHAERDASFPTLAQCDHAFRLMPETSVIERRNKAAFALLLLTGARIGALASFRLKHIDLEKGYVFQDAREVNTKGSKTFRTWFFPVDRMYRDFFESWVRELFEERLFSYRDALFPKPPIKHVDGQFSFEDLSRDPYRNAWQLSIVIKRAFVSAGLPGFNPHSVRTTLALLSNDRCKTMEQTKAWSLNLGHKSLKTTAESYQPVGPERQGELIQGLGKDRLRENN